MKTWIVFVALWGIFKGIREPIKKKALEKTGVLSVLFMYTFTGFLMSAPFARDIFSLSVNAYLFIFLKSAVLFVAWLLGLSSLKRLPVSLYGVIDVTRVIFSTLMGIIFLGESLNLTGVISLILVATGVGLASSKKAVKRENCRYTDIALVIVSCLLNSVSGTIDKHIMTTQNVDSSQLLFWYMLFLSIMYLSYILVTNTKLDIRGSIKNPYIYIMSFLLVFGDKLVFIANQNPESKVTVMTLVKQSSVLVTIFLGMVLYKEKNIIRKIICSGIIILGIMLSV